jgi:hypothetical protein
VSPCPPFFYTQQKKFTKNIKTCQNTGSASGGTGKELNNGGGNILIPLFSRYAFLRRFVYGALLGHKGRVRRDKDERADYTQVYTLRRDTVYPRRAADTFPPVPD